MVYVDNKYKDSFSAPMHDIDPDYKRNNKQYCLDWAKYIYSCYLSGDVAFDQNNHTHFGILKSYARGEQSIEKYVAHFRPKKGRATPNQGNDIDPQNDKGINERMWTSIDFENIFSPMPKIVNAVQGIMESNEHNIVIDAVDSMSVDAREYIKYRKFALSKLEPILKEVEATLGMEQLNESAKVMPTTIEELEILDNLGSFKLPYEIAMEDIVTHTEKLSKNDSVKRKLIFDLFSTHKGSVMTYFDKNMRMFKYKWINIENVIIDKSEQEDYEDAAFSGYIDYVSLNDLIIETGWKEKDIKEIAELFSGKVGNPLESSFTKNNNGSWSCGNYRIPVLRGFWKSTDYKYRKSRTNKSGEVYYIDEPYQSVTKPPKVKSSDNRSTERIAIKTIYKVSWPIGSEKVYDSGRMENIPYNYSTRAADMPIKIISIHGKSPVESSIPILDQIQYSYYRLQNAIIKSPPPGLKIEIGSLEDINIGGKKMLPLDMIRLYAHTGNILYRLRPAMPNMPPNSGKPIEELRGGLGTAVTDSIMSLEMFYKQLSEMTGVDQITSAGVSPNRDQGARVSELAVAATSNVLKPIYTGYTSLKQMAGADVVYRVQHYVNMFDDVKDCPYYDIVGQKLMTLSFAGDRAPAKFGIYIEVAPTDEMKQHIINTAQQALAGGKNGIPALRYSEYLYIVNAIKTGRNIKKIIEYISYKERLSELAAMQQAQANSATQGEILQQQKQAEVQSELAKIEAKGETSIGLERVKGEEDRKTELVKERQHVTN